MKKRFRITDLPSQERPRERLLIKGTENLADHELLALLLGTGTRKKNALSLAKFLLERFPFPKLPVISSAQIQSISGVGKGKATRILAAIELGRRLFALPSLAKINIYLS